MAESDEEGEPGRAGRPVLFDEEQPAVRGQGQLGVQPGLNGLG